MNKNRIKKLRKPDLATVEKEMEKHLHTIAFTSILKRVWTFNMLLE